jgi:hypothetical protein
MGKVIPTTLSHTFWRSFVSMANAVVVGKRGPNTIVAAMESWSLFWVMVCCNLQDMEVASLQRVGDLAEAESHVLKECRQWPANHVRVF